VHRGWGQCAGCMSPSCKPMDTGSCIVRGHESFYRLPHPESCIVLPLAARRKPESVMYHSGISSPWGVRLACGSRSAGPCERFPSERGSFGVFRGVGSVGELEGFRWRDPGSRMSRSGGSGSSCTSGARSAFAHFRVELCERSSKYFRTVPSVCLERERGFSEGFARDVRGAFPRVSRET